MYQIHLQCFWNSYMRSVWILYRPPFLHEITFEDFTKAGGKTKLIKYRTEKVLRFLYIKVLTEKEVLLTTQNFAILISEAATRCVLWKKVFLEISQNSLATWFNSPETCNFIKKEALAQREIFKNTFFEEHLRKAASDYLETSQ